MKSKAGTADMAGAVGATDDIEPYPRPAYAWYVVVILMLAYILSYVDRTILTLLVEPIKRDIGLSDTEVSLLHGIAFALFYTLMGFPIGRFADRHHRVRIIAAGVMIWSLMTAACGLAKSFWSLFLARVGVGFGEAALNPSAYSLIADYFPPHLISRATSTYVMGTYLGFGIAYIVGGTVVGAVSNMPDLELPVLGHIFSWQVAFFYVAAPGLFLLLLFLTIREPLRRGRLYRETGVHQGATLSEFVAFLKTNGRTFLAHSLGFGGMALLVNGMALWTPTFLFRTYGWNMAEAGVAYGVLLLIFGGSGVYLGGWLADWFDRNGRCGGPFKSALLFSAGAVLPAAAYPLMPTAAGALVLMAPMILCSSAPWGVAVSALQQISPNELRGQVGAVYLFTVNLIGIGLGPTLIALITDYYFADPLDLRYSMALVAGGAAITATFLLKWGSRHFGNSLERAKAWQG
tara:strand:- start:7345 stop:8727 length:1383 start_codon:yes stop_codon:yes gene_type:complete